MHDKIKHYYEIFLSPASSLLIKINISPNWVTVIGFIISLSCAYEFAVRNFYLAVTLGVVGGLFDGLDGKLARDTNNVTRFGSFLDSTLDRLSEIAIGGGILYSFVDTDMFLFASLLVFLAITGALTTSYVRARGEVAGYNVKSGILQRPGRGVILFVGALISHKALLIGVGVVAFFAYVTVLQRMFAVLHQSNVDYSDK